MKKLTPLALLICTLNIAGTAQFKKGQKLLGGSISYSTTTNNSDQASVYNNKQSSFSINPSFAWFTSAKRLTGFSVGYGKSKSNEKQNSGSYYRDNSTNSMSAELFTERYYPVVDKLFFTLRGKVGVSHSRGKTISANSPGNEVEYQEKGFNLNAGLAPGITYQLSRRFLFDMRLNDLVSAGYTRGTSRTVKPAINSSKRTQESFAVSSSLSGGTLGNVGFGFRWIIE